MCGRFSLTVNEAELNERFRLAGGSEPYVPRYNCAPTQALAVITNSGNFKLSYMRWGLVPSWAKDLRIGAKMINARAETIMEKVSFRSAMAHRRCLVPATSFFEWKKGGDKIPYAIRLAGGGLFSMAGIWDEWESPEGSRVQSFSIITTAANSLIQPLHDRMPVILSRAHEGLWLLDLPPGELSGFLHPFPGESLELFQVSDLVNSPYHDVPEVLLPV